MGQKLSAIFVVLTLFMVMGVSSCRRPDKSISYHFEKLNNVESLKGKFDGIRSDTAATRILDSVDKTFRNYRLLTGYVWNSGVSPVTPSDLEKGIIINLPSTAKPIGISTIQIPGRTAAGFTFKRLSNSALQLLWKKFAPRYAIKFMMAFETTGEAGPSVEARLTNGVVTEVDDMRPPRTWLLVIEVALAIAGSFIFYVAYRLEVTSIVRKRFSIVMSICSLLAVVYLIYDYIAAINQFVPFR